MSPSAIVGPAASSRPISRAFSINSSSANTRFTRPDSSAFSAGNLSPSSDSSLARALPIKRGSSQVEHVAFQCRLGSSW